MASQFPPPSSHSRKRQRTTEQPPKVSGDAPSRTPRPRVFGGITIREPTSDARPIAQVRSNMASSFRPEVGWQTTFRLGNEPLLVAVSIKTWAQSEGGWIAWSLAQGLLLPKDVHFFSGWTDGSLANKLQWHTIAVIHYPFFSSLYKCTCTFFLFMFVIIVLSGRVAGLCYWWTIEGGHRGCWLGEGLEGSCCCHRKG